MASTTTLTIPHEATSPLETQNRCAHCGQEVPAGLCGVKNGASDATGKRVFCCRGCEAVYRVIHGLGLGYYYQMRGQDQVRASPEVEHAEQFLFLDEPSFQDSRVVKLPNGNVLVTLQLEGIHCAACVWLLEKMPTVLPGVVSARVAFARGIISIEFTPSKLKLSQIVRTVYRLGYPARVIGHSDALENQSYNRTFMLRLGVAGFCLMNIMIMAVGIYGGEGGEIQPRYAQLFAWVSFLLCLPVIFFSSTPFFRTALGGLRAGVFHIDLPISIAIVVGFALSTVNTLRGSTAIYFDSITALVFLLLVGRWVQHRTLERTRGIPELSREFLPQAVRHADGRTVPLESVRVGECVRIEAGETIPVDGTVVEGEGFVQTSFLTGEPAAQRLAQGDTVLAGSILESGQIRVTATATGAASRFGEILAAVGSASRERPPLLTYLDKVSRGFTAIVLVAALFTFLFWISAGMEEAFERAIALLIVTCPCVLAIASPLTFSLAVLRAASRRIFILDARVIEGLEDTRHVLLDKTGTLTIGNAHVELAYIDDSSGVSVERLQQVLMLLERGVMHPVAHALRVFAASATASGDEVKWREKEPNGVHAELSDGEWCVGSERFMESCGCKVLGTARAVLKSPDQQSKSALCIGHRGIVVAVLTLQDPLREGVGGFISMLKERAVHISLLSGDRKGPTFSLAGRIGIPDTQVWAELTPHEKAEIVGKASAACATTMIGDGMNDALAFTKAHVAVGVQGGAVQCAKSSDVFIDLTNLGQLTELFNGARRTLRVVKRSLYISALYNAVGGAGAILGIIGPLEAAILMPLSSLTVISIAVRSRTF